MSVTRAGMSLENAGSAGFSMAWSGSLLNFSWNSSIEKWLGSAQLQPK